jgi:anti-sigma factor RsiW
MNHPFEQLVDLVDGTLGADERARVEAHLAGCTSCREDVAAATLARDEVRALPPAAPPADLHRRVVTAAGGGPAAAGGRPAWYRWAGAAAAAAVVAAIVALPSIGDGGDRRRAAEDAAAGSQAAPASGGAEVAATDSVPLEFQSQDYDERSINQLAKDAGRKRAMAASADTGADGSSRAAISCVQRAATELATGRLTRLIQARFDGRPAYIAVYVEGPSAGQRVDRSTVWVASTEDCSFLSLAGANL